MRFVQIRLAVRGQVVRAWATKGKIDDSVERKNLLLPKKLGVRPVRITGCNRNFTRMPKAAKAIRQIHAGLDVASGQEKDSSCGFIVPISLVFGILPPELIKKLIRIHSGFLLLHIHPTTMPLEPVSGRHLLRQFFELQKSAEIDTTALIEDLPDIFQPGAFVEFIAHGNRGS